jgi:hypothetical protein
MKSWKKFWPYLVTWIQKEESKRSQTKNTRLFFIKIGDIWLWVWRKCRFSASDLYKYILSVQKIVIENKKKLNYWESF